MDGRTLTSILLMLGLSVSAPIAAQHWAPAGVPITVMNQLSQIYTDTATNTTYFCGRTNAVDSSTDNRGKVGVAVYHGDGVWDTLGLFDYDVSTVVMYRDTLIVSGSLTTMGGSTRPPAIAWANGLWHPYGELEGGVSRFRIIDGELYAAGPSRADGQVCDGLAKRSGNRWVPVGNMPQDIGGRNTVMDVIGYNGQLVIAGNVTTPQGDDIFVFDGTNWSPLGGGLRGWNSYAKRMAVYQGDLYVGGGMSMDAGDPGQGIIRWDGANWHPLGVGLQDFLGNFGPYGAAEDMVVHNGELFVGGYFLYAGGVAAGGISRWNGQEWCSLDNEINRSVDCLGFHRDTLYINFGGGNQGPAMNHVIKFIAPAYEGNCGLWAGVEENMMGSGLQLCPNPGTTGFALTGLGSRTATLRLLDLQGREVLAANTVCGSETIATGHLAPGTYVVEVRWPDGRRETMRWMKE